MNIIETNLQFGSMNTRTKTERIILHHAAATTCTVEQVHQWHLNNGWAGIGYHFLVRKDGSIYRGRPEDKVGAHATNHNSNSIGVCAEGNFQNETMPEAQKESLKELVAYIKGKYGINKVQKHSDVNSTSCPGVNYPFNEIVSGEVTPQPTPTPAPTPSGDSTIKSIQSTLNSRYNTGLAVDGIFGSKTKKAMVKGLQIELNSQCGAKLVVDGIFGSKTKKACPVLKNGVRGNITWLVQSMLYIKGYSIKIDSIYGSETGIAVGKFQSNNGLKSDRLCGPNTFEKLFK